MLSSTVKLSEVLQSGVAKAALQQAVVKPGKVDITGREIGGSDGSSLDLVVTPSPAPGQNTFVCT